jgi:hypothetical protein
VTPALDAVRNAHLEGQFNTVEWDTSSARIERVCSLAETSETRPELEILGCQEHQLLAEEIRDRLR